MLYFGILQLEEKLDIFLDEDDVYIGVLPRNDKNSGKEANISCLTCLYADIDYGTEGHKRRSIFNTKEEAVAFIESRPFPPSIIIDTGGGFHLYWLLDGGYNINNQSNTKELLKKFALLNGGDPGCSDLARVLRLPGTYNKKSEKRKPVEIIHADYDALYTLKLIKRIPRNSFRGKNPRYGKII